MPPPTDPFPTPPPGERTLPPGTKPDVPILAAGDRIAGYTLLGVLGEGGWGIVYRARDESLARDVAIKVMRPEFARQEQVRSRFLRDIRSAAAIRSDRVAAIYEAREVAGVPFVVMELLTGATLADRLRRSGAIPFASAAVIARQIAEALDAAHAVGLVHRDVKPSNIWLEANPAGRFRGVKLLDFGFTRSLESHSDTLTRAGMILGTPAYMSPEQARGSKVDARTDLFSLGVVLYEMLTGTRPFAGASLFEVLLQISTESPATASSVNAAVPPAMSALIDGLLAKDPADRPSTMAVIDELRNVVKASRDDLSPSSAAAPLPPPPSVSAALRSPLPERTAYLIPEDFEPSSIRSLPKRGRGHAASPPRPPQFPLASTDDPRGPRLRRGCLALLNPLTWFRRAADPVDVTAFAPPTVPVGNAVMVQLFAHIPEKAAEAKKLATLFDTATGPRGVTSLELEVRRGTALSIHLTAGPLTVDEPWQRLVWRGKTVAVQFAVSAAGNLPPQTVVATAQVFQDAVPIGVVRFKLDVVKVSPNIPPGTPAATGHGTRYRSAFVSYATPDRAEVLKRVQALRAVRVEVFQDILALEPGERWERKLYERIDACDLFLLFWSVAATQSEWVRKELRYAVSRKNGNDESPPDIVPVVLDGPPPPEPPSELKHLHFDDYLVHLIRGAGLVQD